MPKERLDMHVLSKYPQLSRAYVARLIDEGQVLVNGRPSKPGYRLREHDIIKTDIDATQLQQIEDIELPVIYEDDDILVINKPSGVISHARGRYWNEPSVASFVRQKTGLEGQRAGIVHRLDRATSGVMITAKNNESLQFLQRQFGNRTAKKTYAAIITGHLQPGEAVIDMPVERNPKAPSTFRVGSNGKAAQTRYKVLASSGTHQLVELQPLTGRTHQLRVHLKHLGHPVVGDSLYGSEPAGRLCLHALTLEVAVPNGKRVSFSAPLPDIFLDYFPEAAQ